MRLRSRTDLRDYYAVLRNTFIPASLCEVVFVTHPAERACLRQEAFLDAVADGIAGAITRYLSGEQAASCNLRGPLYGL